MEDGWNLRLKVEGDRSFGAQRQEDPEWHLLSFKIQGR